ncbi:MAG: NAD-dependent epimerase/dehydratase family protein [Synechococcus sp. WH 8007]|nr:NAD-dependent epimerase/dehydratase family protein [Synechococcus sp. WH 8007]
MSTILITGAEGFIATNLILKLHQEYGDSVRLVGVDSGINLSKNSEITSEIIAHNRFDLRDTDKLADLMKGCDLVIHLAAKGSVVESVDNPLDNFDCNVVGMLSVLEAMRQADVNKLVFSSTGGALMGNTPPPVNEQSVPMPISPYGASKMACEGYISAYAASYDMSSIIFRFGNVYGPHSGHKKGVLNTWMKKIEQNEEIIIYGDGTSTRDYINVSDICQGLIRGTERLLTKKNDSRVELYHLSNNQEVSLRILLDELSKNYPYNKLIVTYKPERKGEVKNNKAEYGKAQKILGFNPSVNLQNGIKEMVNWLQNQYNLNIAAPPPPAPFLIDKKPDFYFN